jgi:hypothetical protein
MALQPNETTQAKLLLDFVDETTPEGLFRGGSVYAI